MTTLYLRKHIGITKKAVFINSPFDIDKTNKDALYISRNFLVQKHFDDNNIKIRPYPVPNDKDNYDFIVWLALNWFRDKNGEDLSSINGISIGNVIARRVLSAFANDFRNYYAIKKTIDENYSIIASKSESESFKRIAGVFEGKIEWYETTNTETFYDKGLTSDPERTLFIPFPNIHKLSYLARLLQKHFLWFTKKRQILNLSDWTSIKEFNKRNDVLIQNSLFPWKGYYFNYNEDYTNEVEHIFPDKINSCLLNPERINNLVKKHNCPELDNELAVHFCKLIQLEYMKGQRYLRNCYVIYKDAFKYYEPSIVVIPGETHFAYVIAAQLAQTMKIKTVLAIDGYQFVVENSLFYKRKDGLQFIFDKFVAFGKAHKNLLISQGINEESCILSKSPLLETPISINTIKSENEFEFDALIMCYNPNQHNPNITWDKRGEIVINLIKFLLNENFTRIAIKIKSAQEPYSDESYYGELFETFELTREVDILVGPMSEHLNKAKLIIGQISTALFELTFAGVPYYVYEPYENGKTDEMINSSEIFNRKSISRNLEELKISMNNKTPSVISNRKKMFEGPEISKIDFNHFIN
jgi:hypothetical protein